LASNCVLYHFLYCWLS